MPHASCFSPEDDLGLGVLCFGEKERTHGPSAERGLAAAHFFSRRHVRCSTDECRGPPLRPREPGRDAAGPVGRWVGPAAARALTVFPARDKLTCSTVAPTPGKRPRPGRSRLFPVAFSWPPIPW